MEQTPRLSGSARSATLPVMAVALLLAPLLSGCASFGNYMRDRGMDARDILEITFSAYGGSKEEYGNELFDCHVRAIVGPLQVGLGMVKQRFGLKGGEFGRTQTEGGVLLLFGIEKFTYYTEDAEAFVRSRWREKQYQDSPFRNAPYWTRVGVGGGCLFGGTIVVNPGELLDFLLGWIGLDIYGDDFYSRMPANVRAGLTPPEAQ